MALLKQLQDRNPFTRLRDDDIKGDVKTDATREVKQVLTTPPDTYTPERDTSSFISTVNETKVYPTFPVGAGLAGQIQAEADDPAGAQALSEAKAEANSIRPYRKDLRDLKTVLSKLRAKSNRKPSIITILSGLSKGLGGLYKLALNHLDEARKDKDWDMLVNALNQIILENILPPRVSKKVRHLISFKRTSMPRESQTESETPEIQVRPDADEKPPPPNQLLIKDDMSQTEKLETKAINDQVMTKYQLELIEWQKKHEDLLNDYRIRYELNQKGINDWNVQNNIIASIMRENYPNIAITNDDQQKADKLIEIQHQLAPDQQIGIAQKPAPAPYSPLNLVDNPYGATYDRNTQEVHAKMSDDIKRGEYILRDVYRKKIEPTLNSVEKKEEQTPTVGIAQEGLGSILQNSFNRMAIYQRRLLGFDQGIVPQKSLSNPTSNYQLDSAKDASMTFGNGGISNSYIPQDALSHDFRDGNRLR